MIWLHECCKGGRMSREKLDARAECRKARIRRLSFQIAIVDLLNHDRDLEQREDLVIADPGHVAPRPLSISLHDFVRREIRHAGFLAVTAANTPQATSTVRLPIVQWAGAVSTTDYGCGAGFVTNLAQPIWGANDANGLSACIPSASYARGDVLVIRRAGLTAIPSTTALASNTLYVRSEFIGATVFLGPTRPVAQQSPVEDYALRADVYYISNYTNSAAESPQVPALCGEPSEYTSPWSA